MVAIGATRGAARRRGPDTRRFLLGFGASGTAAALQFATFVLTARALGPEAFGILAVVYAWAAVGVEVAGLGADTAMARDAARSRAAFPRAWGHALTLTGLTLVPVVTVAAGAAAWQAGDTVTVAAVAALVAGEVVVGRAVATAEFAAVAHGEPVRGGLARLVSAGARTLTALSVFGVAGLRDIGAWAGATLVQSLVIAGALGLWVTRSYGLPLWGIDRAALRFGVVAMLGQLGRALGGTLDRIVLGSVLGPAGVGPYAAGARLQLLGGLMNQAASRITYPRYFRAAAVGPAALDRLTRAAALRMAAIGLAAGALIAALGQAMPLVLGAGFQAAAPVAAGLAFAAPFTALQYPPADALTACDRQGVRTAVMLAGAILLGALLAVGARVAGLAGAVAAVVAGQALLAAGLWAALLWARRGR